MGGQDGSDYTHTIPTKKRSVISKRPSYIAVIFAEWKVRLSILEEEQRGKSGNGFLVFEGALCIE
jgi:hypothetical protein